MNKLFYGLSMLCLGVAAPVFAQEDNIPGDQGFWQTLVMLGIFIAFFYLIIWRPEQKRRKALEAQRNSLKKGDRVIAMGIIGTVSRLTDQSVILKMIDGAKIEFLRGAITDVLNEESAESEKTDANGKKVELLSDDRDE